MSVKISSSGIARVVLVLVLLAGSLGVMPVQAARASLLSAGETIRVSVSSGGGQGNDHSFGPAISADGRFIAFGSAASNLVPADTNAVEDVFLHDTLTGTTVRVSVSSEGSQGNDSSWMPSITGDGRYVTFSSRASNLVPGDTNDEPDIFLYDTRTGTTTRISVDTNGVQANGPSYMGSISADGHFVAFESDATNLDLVTSDTNGFGDIFLHDVRSGQTGRISAGANGEQANGSSGDPSISADGRQIAFYSMAGNLVMGDTNNYTDVFVYGVGGGPISRVSVDSQGGQVEGQSTSPNISGDGRYVTFDSDAASLVPNDANGVTDIFVHDRQTGITSLVSTDSTGVPANNSSVYPSISHTGRYIAFTSFATNLVPGDANAYPDIFIHDMQTGTTAQASVSSSGVAGDRQSDAASISANGVSIAFSSYAANLVPGDTNVVSDVFVHRQEAVSSNIVYVKQGITGGNNGTSWADAYKDLQPALAAATAGTEIWVAAGTYKPTSGTDRTVSFTLKNDVAIYGGFAGNESQRSDRDPAANVTVLSGNIGFADNDSDNSYHVVVGSSTNITAILDGFTITRGNANTSPNDKGGGMYIEIGSPSLTNIIFTDNYADFGGGMYNVGDENYFLVSNPTLTFVTFDGNSAKSGGGMRNESFSNPSLSHVVFRNNTAVRSGGGMENFQKSSPNLTDVTFENNTAPMGAGMMNWMYNNPSLENVTFTGNSASLGGGMANYTSSPVLKNVLFSKNTVAKNVGDPFGGYGGGISNESGSNPVLQNVTFDGNSAENGGGMANLQSSPKLSDVIFRDNTVTVYGGGLSNDDGSNPALTHVTFSGNKAQNTSDTYGGGMTNQKSSPTLTNVTFYNNSATHGGGILNRDGDSKPTLNHVTFSKNSAAVEGGAIANDGHMVARNSIFWGNSGGEIFNMNNQGSPVAVTNSIVQGGYAGTGNLDSDPYLGLLQDNGGYTPTLALGSGSPAIDTGDDATCAATDQRGVKRPQGSHCDMGAYEFVSDQVAPALLSFTRQDPATETTSADTLVFRATFNEAVSQVDAPDFAVNGTTTATVTNVAAVSTSTYDVTVSGGDLATFNGEVGLNLAAGQDIKDLDGNVLPAGEPATDQTYIVNNILQPLPAGWLGSVSVTSDRNIVAVGRPHVGNEVASYDGFSSGSLSAYVPMLFKNAYGSYNSALYVQNVHASNTANVTIKYYDSAGVLKCTRTDTIAPLSSKGYWAPTETCTTGSLPAGWVGGAVVTSDQPIVAVGRPHVGGEVMTYDGFATGSLTSYIPMLFKGAYGGSYNSAFYVQNVHESNTASITIKYYDSAGNLNCTRADTINPLASKGYWVPTAACDTGSLPAGWIGGVVVTSDQPIVGVGRPHIGTQVTTYNGFTAGTSNSYIPMLFKGAYGGSYNAAFYLQNTHAGNTANITIKYYSSNGTLNCTKADTIAPLASRGYWVPTATCDTGSLPADWVGGVVVTSDQPLVGVGRPHIGTQVTTYNGFTVGSLSSFLPMLFKGAFGGTYNSAFYVQNTENDSAMVTVKFYDTNGDLSCTRTDTIPALSTLGYWVPSVACSQ